MALCAKENVMFNECVNRYCRQRGDSCFASLSSLVSRLSSVLLIPLFLALPAFSAQSSFDLMERANALYRSGKFKQAILLYRKAEDRGADPVAVSFNIANSYYQMDKYPEAAAAYRKAREGHYATDRLDVFPGLNIETQLHKLDE